MKIVETENNYGPLGCLHRTTAAFITAVIHLSPVEKIGGCDQGTAGQSRRALQLPGRWVPSLLLLSLPAVVSCQGEFQQIRSSWAGWLLRAGVCRPVGCSQASDAPPPLLPTTPALSPQPASVFPTQGKPRISLRVPRTPPTPELVGSTFTPRPGGSGGDPADQGQTRCLRWAVAPMWWPWAAKVEATAHTPGVVGHRKSPRLARGWGDVSGGR